MFRRLLPALVLSVVVHAGILALVDGRAPVRREAELVPIEVLRGLGAPGAPEPGGDGSPSAVARPAPRGSVAPAAETRALRETPAPAGTSARPNAPEPGRAIPAAASASAATPAEPTDAPEPALANTNPEASHAPGPTEPAPRRGDFRGQGMASAGSAGAGAAEGLAAAGAGTPGGTGAGAGTGGRNAGLAGDARAEILRRLQESVRRCYPRAALRRRMEGTATVGFCVAPDGRPNDIRITGRTGASLLDRAATECVVPGAAPLPAIGRCLEVPIRFSLRER